ncbi:MAG: hypothetical protein V7682_09780 [Cycloclasticus sp.]
MKKIFVCYTPYHFFLAFIFKNRDEQDIIIFIDQYNKFSGFKEELNTIDNLTFIEYKNSKGIIKFNNYLNVLIKNENIKSTGSIFLFNDRAIHTWIILNKIKPVNVFYIEDGTSAYSNSKISSSNIKKLMLRVFSKIPVIKYEYIEVLGTSDFVDAGYYLYPSYVRVEHRAKPVFQFEKCSEKLNILKKMFLESDVLKKISGEKVLVLLPGARDRYFLMKFQEISKDIAAKHSQSMLMKKHPIEGESHPSQNIHFLPSYYPAEAFIITNISKVVIGSFTTTLHASKFMVEDGIAVNIFTKESKGKNINLYNFLSSIDVKQIEVDDNEFS